MNLSKGLKNEMGLLNEFFGYNDSMGNTKINISELCANVMSPEYESEVEGEGAILTFKNNNFIERANVENLSNSDLRLIEEKRGQSFRVLVQASKVEFDSYCKIIFFTIRII